MMFAMILAKPQEATPMSFDFREIETFVLNLEPHPLEVEKGNFAYWNDLAILAGINLVEESIIASQ